MIGKLDQRITLQEESRTVDGGGGHSTAWANLDTYPTVWAAVEPVTGREALHADQVQDSLTYKITIRRRIGLWPRRCISYGSRTQTRC